MCLFTHRFAKPCWHGLSSRFEIHTVTPAKSLRSEQAKKTVSISGLDTTSSHSRSARAPNTPWQDGSVKEIMLKVPHRTPRSRSNTSKTRGRSSAITCCATRPRQFAASQAHGPSVCDPTKNARQSFKLWRAFCVSGPRHHGKVPLSMRETDAIRRVLRFSQSLILPKQTLVCPQSQAVSRYA